MDKLGWGASIPASCWESCTSPSPPASGLFVGAGIVLGCWARNSRKSGTGQTGRGVFDVSWDSKLGLVQDPALQPSHPRELPLSSCPT